MQDIKSETISITLPYVKLYLDDIEKIINILNEDKPETVLLKANNKVFELSEIEDLHTDELKELEIVASFPSYKQISISFDNHWTRLYCYGNTTTNQGILRKIEIVLKEKTRLLGALARSPYSQLLSSAVGGLAVFTTILLFLKKDSKFLWFHLGISLLFWFVLYLEIFYKNVIFLKHKNHYKNFFTKNKDQIIVGLIVGIPIAIISFLLGRLTR